MVPELVCFYRFRDDRPQGRGISADVLAKSTAVGAGALGTSTGNGDGIVLEKN